MMGDPLEFAGGLAAAGFRALTLTGTVVAAGAVAFRRLVAPRAGLAAAAEVPLARLGAAGAMLVAIAAPFRVWTQAAAFSLEPAETWDYVPRVLGTTWGTAATAQAIAALALAVGLTRSARRAEGGGRDAPGAVLVAIGTLGLIATPAMMGHAIADERSASLAMALDITHVAAAAAWLGALVPLALFARVGNGAVTASLVRAFHRPAMVAATAVVLTGVASTLLRVPSLAGILHSMYGTVLLAKVALVGVALALGAVHYRSGERAAASGAPVWRTLIAEATVAAGIVVATALLTGTEPG
jgi:putative copper resistance protein D